ncbi:MAG TPA: glycosyltransferase [Ktedonosporobacter sp.]|nr:glycosyltransferase [Ktedonosporobacter sp.]
MENVSNIGTTVEPLPDVQIVAYPRTASWPALFWQIVRFGIVGTLNASIDLLALNILLFFFATRNTNLLLLYNVLAYSLGAVNSYLLNKYWTFRRQKVLMSGELLRFTIVNLIGILCNSLLLWVAALLLHPLIANTLLWANAAKIIALLGTAVISYLGMRLWVFASVPAIPGRSGDDPISTSGFLTTRSLSVVMPAHNEEAAIATVVPAVVATLTPWVADFEVIVVNDGSKDRTQAVLEALVEADPRVKVIQHKVNQGYGAALVTGFTAASKDLTFFTDSDGQFDLHDIAPFFPLIETYDAVLGYRIDRQDTAMRKVNAWGWKMLVGLILGVWVRDVDCAFKLYHTEFLRLHTLETRGAMINAEMLYKLKRFGSTYTELGVQHLPRTTGRATGAKISVIMRAMRELFTCALRWRREEQHIKLRTVS